ncbi:hypothetical protein OSTOST_24950 [Ostertagia ostertagi]
MDPGDANARTVARLSSAESPSSGNTVTAAGPTREGNPPIAISQQIMASESHISSSPSDAYIPTAAILSVPSEGGSRNLRACAQLSDTSRTGALTPDLLHSRTTPLSVAPGPLEVPDSTATSSTPTPTVSTTASAHSRPQILSASREADRRSSPLNPISTDSGCNVPRLFSSGPATSPSQATAAAISTEASEGKLLFDFEVAPDWFAPSAVAGDSVRPRASAQLSDTKRASVSSANMAGSSGLSTGSGSTAIGEFPLPPTVDPFAVPSSPLLLEPKEMQQLSLQSTPSTSATPASSSSLGWSPHVRLPPKAFAEFRNPSSPRSRPSSSLAAAGRCCRSLEAVANISTTTTAEGNPASSCLSTSLEGCSRRLC